MPVIGEKFVIIRRSNIRFLQKQMFSDKLSQESVSEMMYFSQSVVWVLLQHNSVSRFISNFILAMFFIYQ